MKWTVAAVALFIELTWAQGTALSPTAHRAVPTERRAKTSRLGRATRWSRRRITACAAILVALRENEGTEEPWSLHDMQEVGGSSPLSPTIKKGLRVD